MSAAFEVHTESSAGGREIRLTGRLSLRDGGGSWRRLQSLREDLSSIQRVDLSGLQSIDGATAAVLQSMRIDARAAGGRFELVGAQPSVGKLLEIYACPDDECSILEAPKTVGVISQIGDGAADGLRTIYALLHSIGGFVRGTGRAIRRPGSVQWRDVPRLVERAGADAVAIVLLMDFLVGLIISLQAADQLEQLGGNVFLADLMGVSMTRELAPLMTAFILAGRSGAAYAAELGTMKVSEELDAARVMGFDPTRFLVLPRLIALGLMIPLLTVLGMIVGCFGGLLVGITALDLTSTIYWGRLQDAVQPLDVVEGLVKSVVFSQAIGLISCHFGLVTRGGAAGVGRSTTGAVVSSLFLLVVLDGVLSSGFRIVRTF